VFGLAPLYNACEGGHDAAVRLLLQYGAKSIREAQIPAPNSSQRCAAAVERLELAQARGCSSLRLEL